MCLKLGIDAVQEVADVIVFRLRQGSMHVPGEILELLGEYPTDVIVAQLTVSEVRALPACHARHVGER
jgi:hypothetical protein